MVLCSQELLMLFYQHTNFHMREHMEWWATPKTFFRLHNLPKNIRQKFPKLPKKFKHEDIFRMPKNFGHK
jgi:hypothetical protein